MEMRVIGDHLENEITRSREQPQLTRSSVYVLADVYLYKVLYYVSRIEDLKEIANHTVLFYLSYLETSACIVACKTTKLD